jgi:hypothetical protein
MQCMYEVVCLLAKQLLNLSALMLLCCSAEQKSLDTNLKIKIYDV